jgi:enoyl-CoA hydratase
LKTKGKAAESASNDAPTVAFGSIAYAVEGCVATITLDRPQRLNAIDDAMPGEIRRAVEAAGDDERVHVIVLQGAGAAFCAGYDLKQYAEGDRARRYSQPMPWDPLRDYRFMKRNTDDFMSLARSPKPTICKVHGYAAAGGSDIALCCDFIVMADDARIGYMPARVWGCPTTAMWVYRLGPMLAKRMLLTGDLIDGREAARIGLALEAVPAAELDACVASWAARIGSVPKSQLALQKLAIQHAVDAMCLANTQVLATLLDGITRHSPEGQWFKAYAERHGFAAAAEWRDSGRTLPEPPPGWQPQEDDPWLAPPAAADARSAWSRDVAGKRGGAGDQVSAPAPPGGRTKAAKAPK